MARWCLAVRVWHHCWSATVVAGRCGALTALKIDSVRRGRHPDRPRCPMMTILRKAGVRYVWGPLRSRRCGIPRGECEFSRVAGTHHPAIADLPRGTRVARRVRRRCAMATATQTERVSEPLRWPTREALE